MQWGRLSYPGQSLRDANRTVLGTSYAHAFRNRLLVFAGAYTGLEKERASGVQRFGHKIAGLRIGSQKSLRDEFAVFGTLSYEDRAPICLPHPHPHNHCPCHRCHNRHLQRQYRHRHNHRRRRYQRHRR